MSADEIRQRIGRTEEFLKRLDSNGNGLIDASEADDSSAKMMLDRIFSRIGTEPRYPMAIRDVVHSYEGYYRARGSNGSRSTGGFSSTTSAPAAGDGLKSPPGMGFGAPVTPPPGPGTSVTSAPHAATPPAPHVPPAAMPGVVTLSTTGSPAAVGMVPLVSGTASTAPVVPADSTATTPAPASGSSAEKPPATRSGRFLTAKERLPKGLPDWFSEKDADHDGQVGMSEYAGRWSPETVAEFAQYDLNHDGIITAAECLKAEKLKAGK